MRLTDSRQQHTTNETLTAAAQVAADALAKEPRCQPDEPRAHTRALCSGDLFVHTEKSLMSGRGVDVQWLRPFPATGTKFVKSVVSRGEELACPLSGGESQLARAIHVPAPGSAGPPPRAPVPIRRGAASGSPLYRALSHGTRQRVPVHLLVGWWRLAMAEPVPRMYEEV